MLIVPSSRNTFFDVFILFHPHPIPLPNGERARRSFSKIMWRLPRAEIQPILCGMTSPTLTPQAFVDKWRHATLKERSALARRFAA
jgi:hypothetical protein